MLAAAVAAAEPGAAVRRALSRAGSAVVAGGRAYELGGGRVLLVAVGKAAAPMAAAAADVLGELLGAGVVVTKAGAPGGLLPALRLVEAGHPVPDERSVAAGRAVAKLLAGPRKRDLVLALISGGGSALLDAARARRGARRHPGADAGAAGLGRRHRRNQHAAQAPGPGEGRRAGAPSPGRPGWRRWCSPTLWAARWT